MIAEEIGLKWARRIAVAFMAWVEKIRKTLRIVPFDPTELITLAFTEAGQAQLDDIGKGLGVVIKFDLKSPEAIEWCKKYGASQVKEVNAATKAAIREITRRGLEEGLSPAEQSKAIRQIIGLNQRQLVTLNNYKAALGDAATDKLIEKEYRRLLKLRADTIGLTESHTATNHGQLQSYKDSVKGGIIKKSDYRMQWLYTPDKRVCQKCTSYNGTHAEIGGTFPNGLECPPSHPRCRCTTILVGK